MILGVEAKHLCSQKSFFPVYHALAEVLHPVCALDSSGELKKKRLLGPIADYNLISEHS